VAVAKGLTYADAAVLLGGNGRNPVLATLDRLAGGVLLTASATGAAFPLSLFDAKAEFLRLSEELVRSATNRLRRTRRASRTESLVAANAVLVIAAYFEALRTVALPLDLDELEMTAREQITVATGGHPGTELTAALLRSPVPIPQPQRPYEQTIAELECFYDDLGRAVLRFFAGLAVWVGLPSEAKDATEAAIRTEVTGPAVGTYEEMFRRLATEFPEVAFWANLADHQATRVEVREVRTALGGLADILTGIATGSPPDELRTRLAQAYQATLRRPVLATREVPGGLSVPSVEECYVNPDFKVAADVSAEDIANRDWWVGQPRRADLQRFLVGYLTSSASTEAPLLVMGQPGTGKSMLTQVLAAQLPATDFLTVRVALRELDADADLQTHVEEAVRTAIGESLTWPRLAGAAGDAIPVVLIDGFDELLQATGVSQSSYLEKAAAFQQREADLGRPVVVLVTTRMSMAHRARPVGGMTVVLLEPFDDDQIARWLAVWHDRNAVQLAARGLRPLPVEVALNHRDLAAQPLLLLLLALYDAESNALRHENAHLDQAELYERLMTAFARREVLKSGAELTEEQLADAVDRELRALSIVAFATLNRQQLWVSESELDTDLHALASGVVRGGGQSTLTAAQIVVGRFYFVHVAQAVRGTALLRTIEFLHATFGEYLITRLVVGELRGLVDDDFLHAMLSFAPLTMQPNTVSFITSLFERQLPEDRERMADLLLGLFRDSLKPRRTEISDYRPTQASVPARYAAYSANLLLLTVIAHGEVTSDQLFPGGTSVEDWARTARLWQSQLPNEGWENLVRYATVTRHWAGTERQVRISSDGPRWERPDIYWTYGFSPTSRQRSGSRFGWISHSTDVMRAEATFLCAVGEDTFVHALAPLLGAFGSTITTFHDLQGRGPVSPAHALFYLWLRSTIGPTPLTDAAETCLRIAMHGFAPADKLTRHRFRELVLRQFVAIRDRLPEHWLSRIAARVESEPDLDRRERDDLLEMVQRILGN
jgi:NACHT conflict system protein/ATPase family protein associated with various cellular activities (AAA)